MPEGRGIFPNLTVYENFVMAREPGRWTLARVHGLFPRLRERKSHWGNQLSGGEQQMLSIGRALMLNPTLIMLDEATEGLAPLVQQEIWACLASSGGRDLHPRRRQEYQGADPARPAALRHPQGRNLLDRHKRRTEANRAALDRYITL